VPNVFDTKRSQVVDQELFFDSLRNDSRVTWIEIDVLLRSVTFEDRSIIKREFELFAITHPHNVDFLHVGECRNPACARNRNPLSPGSIHRFPRRFDWNSARTERVEVVIACGSIRTAITRSMPRRYGNGESSGQPHEGHSELIRTVMIQIGKEKLHYPSQRILEPKS
jgi:hypothetical protein